MTYTSIESLYKIFLKNNSVATDTRSITPGSIFFALKGSNFNGNEFAAQAIEKGAAYAVIDDEKHFLNEKYFLVKDVLACLQELAKYHREQLKIPVLGITGSNGKTTTKELISTVLSKRYKTYATKGNLNNHIGVPLTLLAIKPEYEFAVIEMGANHVGEIAMLCNIARPDYGIITNIGRAHLEGFGGPAGVIKAKNELYQFIKTVNGKLFVNADNELLMDLSKSINRITYGTSAADYCGQLIDVNPFVQLQLDKQLAVSTHLVGKYNFENVLAAACIGNYFGVVSDKIKEALQNYVPSNNRSEVVRKGSNVILLDAYNANPTSMRAAIENIFEMKATDKMLVLGDMLELGAESAQEHKAIIELATQKGFSNVCFIGERFKSAYTGTDFKTFLTTTEATDWLKHNLPKHTTILIKGSREKKLEQLLSAFD